MATSSTSRPVHADRREPHFCPMPAVSALVDDVVIGNVGWCPIDREASG
jgi:hypothetical protein